MDDSRENSSISRLEILEKIDRGEISVDEGLKHISNLENEIEQQLSVDEQSGNHIRDEEMNIYVGSVENSIPANMPNKANWWRVPFWVGIGMATAGALLMFQISLSSGYGFWFFCASAPLFLGLLLLMLAFVSRKGPWLHLRVSNRPNDWPQNFAIRFPIPIRPTVWFLRTFRNRIPRLEDTSLDEVLLAVGAETSPENPIFIQVDEGEEGENVEIFIG